jgi:hypothetical protein
MTIVKRGVKGTALTYDEMDENIRDLYEDTTIDRVLGNGNITTKNISVGTLTATTVDATTVDAANVDATTIDTTNINATTIITGTVSDTKGEIRSVPQETKITSYVLQSSDHGKYISTTAGVTLNISTFTIGQNVTIFNNSSSTITITQGASVTLYQVGTSNTGNRTLEQRGLATILCVDVNKFVITGGGLN